MTSAKLFQNGRSQAVRLPKEFRFTGKTVFVQRFGNGVLLLPETEGWETLFEACDEFTDDFLAEGRKQEPPQSRPALQ